MNKRIPLGLISGVLSFSACSASRNHNQEQFTHEKDSISTIRFDHISRKTGVRSHVFQAAALQHVSFSAPDSSGRQYPLSVTTAILQERTERSTADTASFSTAQAAIRISATTHAAKKSNEQNHRFIPGWIWLTGGLTILSACLFLFISPKGMRQKTNNPA